MTGELITPTGLLVMSADDMHAALEAFLEHARTAPVEDTAVEMTMEEFLAGLDRRAHDR